MTRNFPATNQASVIPKNYTYMNHNTGLVETICDSIFSQFRSETCGSSMGSSLSQNLAFTGLEEATCGSIVSKCRSETCGSSMGSSLPQNLALNLPMGQNNNSLSPTSSSSCSPNNNDTINQNRIKPVNDINNQEKDKEISNLWSNKAPTNNIETDLPTIAPENSIFHEHHDPFHEHHDPFGLKAIHDHLLHNSTTNSIWYQKFNDTSTLPGNPTQDKIFGDNLYESNTFLHDIDQLSWR